jgi:hypothetical protein
VRYRVTVGKTLRASLAPLSDGGSLFPESDAEVIASNGLVLELSPDQPESPHGGYWMPNSWGFHSAAAVYLSSVLVPPSSIPERYYLTAKACAGILRRARRRGKALPHVLEMALRQRAYGSTTLPAVLEETIEAVIEHREQLTPRKVKAKMPDTLDLFT